MSGAVPAWTSPVRVFRGDVNNVPMRVEMHVEYFRFYYAGRFIAARDYEQSRVFQFRIDPRLNGGPERELELKIEPLGPLVLVVSRHPTWWLCVCHVRAPSGHWERVELE